MADYEFPEAPEIEAAYRAAQQALLGIIPPERTYGDGEDYLDVTELISHFRTVLDEAEMTVAGRLGPLISWRGPHREGDWNLIAAGIDLEGSGRDFGDADLDEGAIEGPDGMWHGSPLERAGYAYKREAGWDFTPDETGVWVLMLAPRSASGGSEDDRPWFYNGHLVGFVILQDRDNDGNYESVAHIWTASAWRRRGIARRLLAEAKSRFAIAGVEGPYTDDGDAFLRAVGELETEDET
jgi:GNAT superfamily N-acetyltransferase